MTIQNELVEKTMRELTKPKHPQSRSRIWKDPEGYKYLVAWSNAVLLRFLIRLITNSLSKSEYRRKSQLDDAGRSVVRNIEEGYKRATTSEYLQFIGYSQGSLEEVKGDIRELTEDRFLRSVPSSSLVGISLDLGNLNQALKGNKGQIKDGIKSSNPPLTSSKSNLKPWEYHPLTILYPPLAKVRAENLTYEVFLELINKTDWNLRKLVQSLEKKVVADQKGYQIEKARIRNNLTWKR